MLSGVHFANVNLCCLSESMSKMDFGHKHVILSVMQLSFEGFHKHFHSVVLPDSIHRATCTQQ